MGNIINGVGHAVGYRNFETKDQSHNILPLGLWIVGEELHNNHHADPRSAKFKARWFEIDIGWMYIRLLSVLRLADVLYARDVSAREFASRYYQRASDVALTARTAAMEAVEEARTAAHAASYRAKEAVDDARTAAKAASTRARDAAGRAAASAREAAQSAGAALNSNKSLPTTE
jgi:hypothetical protein